MDLFLQLVLSGLATGCIYACLALAVVTIHTTSGQVNFAQGEMAMFSAYIAWSLIDLGLPYWLAFILTLAVSFLGAAMIQIFLLRPMAQASILSHVIVFLGLFTIFNSTAGWIWSFTIKPFPSPFPEGSVMGLIGFHELGVLGVVLVLLAAVYAFLNFTPVGLAMRAAAENPTSARLVGIRVGRMLALGWGLAAVMGAAAGMMIAPVVYLEPNMMAGILLYGFAAAVVGGIDSPAGAVAGGILVGVIENLAGAYLPFIGNELKLSTALLVIVIVLLVKPSGLFGRTAVNRV
ncbi:MAG: branched-chain amino acid ABC transporter permease [Acidobacteriota bacterium]|nr:branched-chain amino acid ABC transporter permease [Acidobacteriota bacterium]